MLRRRAACRASWQPWVVRAIVVLCGLLAPACVTEATEALVIFDTNTPADRITIITAVVNRGSTAAPPIIRLYGATPDTIVLPASFAVVPGTSGAIDELVTARIRLDVSAGPHGEPSIHFDRTTRFRLVPHRAMHVRIYLPVQCGDRSTGCTSVSTEDCTVSVRCNELNQTCGDHALCVAPDVPLEPINPRDVAVGEHAPNPPDLDAAADGEAPDAVVASDTRADRTPGDVLRDVSTDSIAVDTGPDSADAATDVIATDISLCPGGMHECSGTCLWNSSSLSCGASCVPCPANAHAIPACDGVSCGNECNVGFGDCDGDVANGCETNLGLPAHCGSCTTVCDAANPICTIYGGVRACVPSCGGTSALCGLVCADLQNDPTNCRICGRVCPPVPNASPTCTAAVCGFDCNPGFHNCSGVCRSDTSVATCGTSCLPCRPPTNATATCDGTTCDFVCDTGWSRLGATCVTAPAPRQVGPLSTNTVTSTTPTLSWVLPGGGTGASVTMCTNRAMTLGCTSFEVTGSSGRPPAALTPGVWFWKLQTVSGTLRGALASAVWQFVVGAANAPVNAHWGALPDVNGDGFGDVVVGAPASASVSVFLGGASGTSAAAATRLTAPAGSRFGAVIASAGDVNGDGFADIAVGGASGVSVFLGSPAGLRTTPASTIAATNPSVSAAGDVNGDGFGDVIVGEPGVDVAVYAGSVSGLGTSRMTTLSSMLAGFGESVASAGDVNADGFGDVLVAAPGDHTAVVYLGSAAGLATVGTTLGHVTSAACAGDLDGDGFADIVVGAADESLVYVAHGGPTGLGSLGAGFTVAGSTGLGSAVAGAGDVDGDGRADVIVGNSLSGTVWLFRGNMAASLASPPVLVSTTLSGVGAIVAGVGDTQGDHLADFALGSPTATSVQVFSGVASGAPVAGRVLTGTAGFGGSLAH